MNRYVFPARPLSVCSVAPHPLPVSYTHLYLPESHTDFIFANICEELGLIGALAVLALFVMLGYRGLRAAVLSTDPFARFLAFGITTAILVQAFFNMSVVLALLPTKGITLPLISSGGTSVFITLASLGVLLNITRAID